MFQDAPIYHRLIAERGDVPARVRDAAASIRLELEGVMGQSLEAFRPNSASAGMPSQPRPALHPGSQT
ncbi:hypothetical protein [Streptomyces sp. NPDC046197]|uniref:hypothetical protein n=1 Tax=Streptomyces sp. NPDC046197 TaxID=3154337 RepID=UPI0034101EEF